MTRRVAPSINLIPDGDKMHLSQQMIINVHYVQRFQVLSNFMFVIRMDFFEITSVNKIN